MNGLPPEGLYGISAAAELTGVGEQTIRLYERRGLITPHRTSGGTRRYNDDDVATVRRVAAMLLEGFNLMGVRRILELEVINEDLRRRLS